MHLNVYLAIDGESVEDAEEAIFYDWSDEATEVGQLVSMGGIDDWIVIRAVDYESPTMQGLLTTTLLYAAKADKPVPKDNLWQGMPSRDYFPDQAIELFFSKEDQELINLRIAMDGKALALGEKLSEPQWNESKKSFEMVFTNWVKVENAVFIALDDAPYRTIFVSHFDREPQLIAA